MSGRVYILMAVVLGLGLLGPATAQPADRLGDYRLALADGVAAYEGGAYDQTVRLLVPVVNEVPGFAAPPLGAAAYWLGRAFERMGEAAQMRQAWRVGLSHLIGTPAFDVRLADAYLRSLSAEEHAAHPEESAGLYRLLLAHLGDDLTPEERLVMTRHAAHLALLLSDEQRRAVFSHTADDPATPWAFAPDAGARLLHWWRSQDPLPASRPNERLGEHLVRVAHAEAHFPNPERPTGLDERGEVYVRYGPPEREIDIDWTDPVLGDLLTRPGVAVSPSDFPEGAFWRYGSLDRAAYFVFVEEHGHYRLGETTDLIPRTLRFGFSGTRRGQEKAVRLIAAMQVLLRQLAPLHPDFDVRYADVDNFAMELPELRTGRLANRARQGFRAPDLATPGGTARTPTDFADQLLVQTREEDGLAFARRETYVPRQATEVFRELERLPVEMRAVRFLDDDGSTRTELYWSPAAGSLEPSRRRRRALEDEGFKRFDTFVINMTAVQKTLDYRERVVNQNRYFITDLPDAKDATIPIQTMTVRGDTATYHLALQWDQYLPERIEGDRVDLGPKVKVGAFTLDTLAVLDPAPGRLEMSDLKPIFLAEETGVLPSGAAAPAYPFSVITPSTPLALYFEAYHLTYGPDDMTHYTVTYEVARSGAKGALLRFLGGRDEAKTSSRVTNTGASRTARETILLDFHEWDGVGELAIRVHLTDETTGQTTERTLTFTLQPE